MHIAGWESTAPLCGSEMGRVIFFYDEGKRQCLEVGLHYSTGRQGSVAPVAEEEDCAIFNGGGIRGNVHSDKGERHIATTTGTGWLQPVAC